MPKISFIKALELLEEEKGINKDEVLEALKEALAKAYKKNNAGPDSIIEVNFTDKGKIKLYEVKTVVEEVQNEDCEIDLETAQSYKKSYKLGDEVKIEADPELFSRLVAIQTKQLLRQKIKEAEKESLYNEFIDKKDEIITGIVDRVDDRFAIINLGRNGALLPKNHQIPGEQIFEGQHIKVYVSDVERNTKGTHICVSRTDPGLVKRLFEMNVPEIFDGVVEIKSVSREPGERSKIAVYTSNPDVDPIGSCVGQKGSRVRSIVSELNGEMIDIVEWSEDPVVYITHALSPSEVICVIPNYDDKSALVVVPDDQLSLAIGKRGQNARLAVRLTDWKIDIKSVSEANEAGIDFDASTFVSNKKHDDEDVPEFDQELFDAMIHNSEDDLVDDVEEIEEVESIDEVEEIEEAEEIEEVEETVEEETIEEVVEETETVETTDNQVEETSSDDEDYDEDYDDDYDDEDYDDDYDDRYDEDIDYDEYDHYYDD